WARATCSIDPSTAASCWRACAPTIWYRPRPEKQEGSRLRHAEAAGGSAVVLGRQFVHRLDEGAGVGRIHFRGDAVAQVEHVTGAAAVGGQDTPYLGTNGLGLGVQHARVHVALQRHLVTDAGAGVANVAGPVQTQRLDTGLG